MVFERSTVTFQGRVQGVGFRYATHEVATGFEVAGYVLNLPDGRVQVEVEGRPEEIAAFIAAVEERMAGYVRKTERSSRPVTAQGFQGFVIR